MPTLEYLNLRFTPDGRTSADLNGCRIHKNVCDLIKWDDGTLECALCARDRQPEMKLDNPAYHLKPYWEWIK